MHHLYAAKFRPSKVNNRCFSSLIICICIQCGFSLKVNTKIISELTVLPSLQVPLCRAV